MQLLFFSDARASLPKERAICSKGGKNLQALSEEQEGLWQSRCSDCAYEELRSLVRFTRLKGQESLVPCDVLSMPLQRRGQWMPATQNSLQNFG